MQSRLSYFIQNTVAKTISPGSSLWPGHVSPGSFQTPAASLQTQPAHSDSWGVSALSLLLLMPCWGAPFCSHGAAGLALTFLSLLPCSRGDQEISQGSCNILAALPYCLPSQFPSECSPPWCPKEKLGHQWVKAWCVSQKHRLAYRHHYPTVSSSILLFLVGPNCNLFAAMIFLFCICSDTENPICG